MYVDNKGTVDFANNWSTAGRTRHVACKFNYIRSLKESELVEVKKKDGEEILPDIGTKNTAYKQFAK